MKVSLACGLISWILLMIVGSSAAGGLSTIQPDPVNPQEIECSRLNQIEYVRDLKNLAHNLILGKPLDTHSVKLNITNCFFNINSLQELILQLREFETTANELRSTAEPHIRDLCYQAAHCIRNKPFLITQIIRAGTDDPDFSSTRKLAKLTFADARCYADHYRCSTEYPELAESLAVSGSIGHRYSTASLLLSICWTISVMLNHQFM